MSRRSRIRRPVSARARRRTSMLWGIGVLLLVAAGVYAIFGGRVPGTGGREVVVVVRDAGALRAATATKVRVAGVDVGRVTAVRPDPDAPGLAEIVLELDDDAPVVREDATIEIRPRLFLEGNFVVELRPGSPGARPLAGRPLPPSAATVHVAVDEVLRTFQAGTREDLRATLGGLSRTLDGQGARSVRGLVRATPALLDDVTVVARAVRGAEPGDLPGAIRETGELLDVLADRRTALRGVLRDGRRTFDAFAAGQSDLRATLTGLDRLTASLPPSLDRIDAGTPEARALVRTARPLVRRLSPTLDAAAPGLRSVLRFTRSGAPGRLLTELRPASAELAEAADPLGRGLEPLRAVGVCLRRNLVPVLNAEVPDGPLSTGTPVYAEFLSSMVGLAGGAQDFDANGPWVRYLVGLGNQLVSLGGPAESLAGRATRPIAGSSPAPTTPPPLRPDVPCETQPVAQLLARATPFRGAQRRAPIDDDRVSDAVDRLLRKGDATAGGATADDGPSDATARGTTADDGGVGAGRDRSATRGADPAAAAARIRRALGTLIAPGADGGDR
ncbi:MlaD family protein [Patulibacter sp.]|uniref:MlaD family protein n=1 Tax=Patulibacter sp. TaxID=1912859 RepID=UPI002719DDE1|nr:MlaD family protein [Patulibacter sp.]MDO9410011.1 MlaD family protein [Patulibacter sp.]